MNSKLKEEFPLENLKNESKQNQIQIIRATYFGTDSITGNQDISVDPTELKPCCSNSNQCNGCFESTVLHSRQLFCCTVCGKISTPI